jgi:hypothetical protein
MKLAFELAAFLIAFLCLSNAFRAFADLRLHVKRTVPMGAHDLPAH